MNNQAFSILETFTLHQNRMMRLLTEHNAPIQVAMEMANEQALQRAIYIPQTVLVALSYHFDESLLEEAPDPQPETVGLPWTRAAPVTRTEYDSTPNRTERRAQARRFGKFMKQFKNYKMPLGAEE